MTFFSNAPSRHLLLVAAILTLNACSSYDLSDSFYAEDAQIADDTKTADMLKSLPPPSQPVVLAVYNFDDKTGQQKPSESFPEYSRAVTQGGAAILSKALYDAGNGRWFTVLEREGLNNLIQERKIIRATRAEYAPADGSQLGDVGPMLYAGLLLEGGIVSYESNTVTGGVGARYLGIGGDTQYRRDVVTVALRAVSVQTGQVLVSVNTSKTIFSTAVNGGVNKFVAVDKVLEIESGFSLNEPPQYAVRQAIELAVYSLVVEGAQKGLWSFADRAGGQRVIDHYRQMQAEAYQRPLEEPYRQPPELPYRAMPVQDEYKMAPAPASALPPPAPVSAQPLPPTAAPAESNNLPFLPPPAPPASESNTIRQLPEGAKLKPEAEKAVPQLESAPDQGLQPYRQRGVVYCGPSGCVPSYEPPVAQ